VNHKSIVLACTAFLPSCSQHIQNIPPTADIIINYISLDHRYVAVFSKHGAHIRVPAMLSAALPMSDITSIDTDIGVKCISVGPPLTSVEFAIKSNASEGDSYSCKRSKFYVEKCFDSCRSYVVTIQPIDTVGDYRSNLISRIYFNRCVGITKIDLDEPLKSENPFRSLDLTSTSGLFADDDPLSCLKSDQ
jgi:hypothetical protein